MTLTEYFAWSIAVFGALFILGGVAGGTVLTVLAGLGMFVVALLVAKFSGGIDNEED